MHRDEFVEDRTEQELTEPERLRQLVRRLEEEKADLAILLDNTTQHSTFIEAELDTQNALMRLYIDQAKLITVAAAAVEEGEFVPESLDSVAGRSDELGQLARVFQRMAREVAIRELRLRQEVAQLKIEIDTVKQTQEVSEITDTDFFRDLQRKARTMRAASPPEER